MMENFDLEKFKNYVNTYDKQMGHKKYSVKTIIDDFLYGIGICLDEDNEHTQGYRKFKEELSKHLNAVPDSEITKKCYYRNTVDITNPDCEAFSLCKDHASDS